MIPRCVFGLPLLAALPLFGETPERAIIAAMRLAEEPNYSWTTVVSDDARSYEIEGRTWRGGFTWQRQPMPESIAKRIGRIDDPHLEAFFRGPLEYIVRTPGGWQLPDELPRKHPDWVDQDSTWYVAVPVQPDPLLTANVGVDPLAPPPIVYVPVEREEEERPWSNYQFALSRPHDELAIVVSSFAALDVDGDVATGTLTDLGAALLLVHDGHEYIHPLAGAGTFKLWIRDGLVTKYSLQLAGVVEVGRKRHLVQQTNTTTIRDVGRTAPMVPLEVRQKLR